MWKLASVEYWQRVAAITDALMALPVVLPSTRRHCQPQVFKPVLLRLLHPECCAWPARASIASPRSITCPSCSCCSATQTRTSAAYYSAPATT